VSDVIVLVGNPRAGSRTRQIALDLANALAGPDDGVRVLELAEVVGVSFGPQPAHGVTDGTDPFATVRAARLLIVATPAYKGTFTGLLKLFLDQFGHRELDGVTALAVAVAASPAHAEAAAAALRDVLVELGAIVGTPPLAVQESRLAESHEIVSAYLPLLEGSRR
jgi:FMN reductase